MKQWAMPSRAIQKGWVIVKSSDKLCFTGGGNGNPLCILAARIPWRVWKGKKIKYWKISLPGQKVSKMLLEESGEIDPERMRSLSQSANNDQLWMCLVVNVNSNAVNNNIA